MADFIGNDFIDSYDEVLNYIKEASNWDPETSSESNPGVVLTKAFCLLADKIQYKIDINTAQAYLPTVTDRQTAFEVLQSLGYVMKEAKSASGRISMTLRQTSSGEITSKTLPIFTQVTDDTGTVSYFTTSDVTLTSSNIQQLVPVMEGSPFVIEKEGVDSYSIKDIDEDGRFFLQKSGIAQNGVFVAVVNDDGTLDYSQWQIIEGSVLYPESEHFYYVMTDSDGENYIQFPKNFAQLFGSSNFQVMATFTKGAGGNITKQTLTKITGNALANVVVRQSSDITTGVDAEDIQTAVSRYNETMQIFNTLVTAHDYNGALKYILQDGARIFSNAYAKTAKDRQLKIITRSGTKQYTFNQFDDSKSDRIIEALCLKYSQNYSESFQVVYPDDKISLQQQVQNSFNGANSLTAEIEVIQSQRYLAVTNLVGSIFANVSTKYQSEQVIDNVVAYLKGKYSANELQFGSQLDYQQLINDIKKADSRIANVALNIPEYQVFLKYEQVDGVPSQTFGENDIEIKQEKRNIVAEAVLAGRLPLYKYMNRPNTSVVSSNDSYRPIPFDVSEVNGFENKVNPKVTAFFNGTRSWDKTGANKNGLVACQILQFNRVIQSGKTEYGYGYQYAFYRSGDSGQIGSPLTITTTPTTLAAGTIIGSGSILNSDLDFEDETLIAAAGLPSGSKVKHLTLVTDYTVQNSISLVGATGDESPTVLSATTIISPNSKVNGVAWSPEALQDGAEYRLKPGETLLIGKSSVGTPEVTLTEGTWIIPSGVSITSNGTSGSLTVANQVLQSSQKITILAPDVSTISPDFMYFLKLNNKSSITLPEYSENSLTNGYMLEEGEYFVYADSALSEYVILGAGTILTVEGTTSATLNNLVTEDIENVSNESYFEKLGVSVRAVATETMTYMAEDNIEVLVKLSETETVDNQGGNVYSTYKTFPAGDYISVFESGSEEGRIFDSSGEWRYRVALLLSSNQSGQVKLGEGVAVYLTDGTENYQITAGSGVGANEVFICTSSPFQAVLSTGIDNQTLFPEGQSQLVTWYKTKELENFKSSTPSNTSLLIEATSTINNLNVPMLLMPSTSINFSGILFNVTLTKGSSNQKFTVTFTTNISSVKPTVLGKTGVNSLSDTDENIYTISIPVNKGVTNLTSLYITITSENGTITTDTPLEILLSDLSYVTDYSDQVKYIELSNGTPLSTLAPDYYVPEDGNLLEQEILEKQTSQRFSYLCSPDEKLNHPTKSSEFFVSEHPRNYCTIPYIDFEKTKETLKIISTSGAILK